MKFKFSIILLIIFNVSFFYSAPVDSKYGYKDLKWGTSLAMTKMSGYEVSLVDEDVLKSEQNNYKKKITIYNVLNLNDEAVNLVWLYFSNDKLFYVMERLNKAYTSESKLAARYGKLDFLGFHKIENNLYGDPDYDNEFLINESIEVRVLKDYALTKVYDWNTYSVINKEVLKLSGKATVVDELETVAVELTDEITANEKKSFAFIPMSSNDSEVAINNYITDALTEAVFNLHKVRIVERRSVEKILKEQKFQSSGLVDETSAKEIGKIAGVDYICFGNVKNSNNTYSVNAKVVDVESGEVISISRCEIRKDKYINDIEQSTGKGTTQKSKQKKTASGNHTGSLWGCIKRVNEDNKSYVYTFTLPGNDEEFLFVGVEERLNGSLCVKAGIHWTSIWMETFTIKFDDNEEFRKELKQKKWKYDTGFDSDTRYNFNEYGFNFLYSQKVPASFFLNGFAESDSVSVKLNKVERRFSTAGLIEKIESTGLSWEKVKEAAESETF